MTPPTGSVASPLPAAPLTKKDFKTDQEVRWCPGCGDYGILNSLQMAFASLGIDRDKTVIVSGIGCSSRLPYYMETYGFHTIHGRAPAIATGLKLANPELEVWVGTGDGDALSIGGNHLIHALRRNVDIKILMFNNRIYGLTKGQYSPTSLIGAKSKSTPIGSVEHPFNPIALALGAGATFVARTVDVFGKHLEEIVKRAHAHKGAAFIEILQNCNIFNDGAWDHVTTKEIRDDAVLTLQHGKPLVFGKEKNRGIRLNGMDPEAVELGAGVTEADLMVWNENAPSSTLAYALSQLPEQGFPTPIGVFRDVATPTYEKGVRQQIDDSIARQGPGDLKKLIYSGDVWEVTAR
jgi:2-oxoglutarate ferredoxin oxidoreductase subunit beta